MSNDIVHGNGFVVPPGSTPVRKEKIREAVAMIDRGKSINAAIDAVYGDYVGEPWREAGEETLIRNTKTIEKGIRRLIAKRKVATE